MFYPQCTNIANDNKPLLTSAVSKSLKPNLMQLSPAEVARRIGLVFLLWLVQRVKFHTGRVDLE